MFTTHHAVDRAGQRRLRLPDKRLQFRAQILPETTKRFRVDFFQQLNPSDSSGATLTNSAGSRFALAPVVFLDSDPLFVLRETIPLARFAAGYRVRTSRAVHEQSALPSEVANSVFPLATADTFFLVRVRKSGDSRVPFSCPVSDLPPRLLRVVEPGGSAHFASPHESTPSEISIVNGTLNMCISGMTSAIVSFTEATISFGTSNRISSWIGKRM